MVTFQELLATVGKADVSELQARKEKLEKRRAELQAKLAEVQRELQQVESELNAPIRQAVKAAKLLGIEVPEQYRQQANGNGNRSQGRYYWEAKGQVPFQAEVSRAMWRLSQGSGGSAGKNGEGVLTAEEFWRLTGMVEEQAELGKKYQVTLPNGKQVTFQRIE